MDQYKENENNPTNENDGKEPVIPEPEFEEVKAHQPDDGGRQPDSDGGAQASDADTTQFTVENTFDSKPVNENGNTQEFETSAAGSDSADGSNSAAHSTSAEYSTSADGSNSAAYSTSADGAQGNTGFSRDDNTS